MSGGAYRLCFAGGADLPTRLGHDCAGGAGAVLNSVAWITSRKPASDNRRNSDSRQHGTRHTAVDDRASVVVSKACACG